MVLPILFILFLGAYDTSQLASDKFQILGGARHGARIASELGGVPNNPAPPATHTCDGTLAAGTTLAVIDKQIVLAVAAATSNVTSASITEIDIYAPSAVNGAYTNGDPINRYKPNGSAYSPLPGDTLTVNAFPLTARCQGPVGTTPKDVSIGVRVVWSYTEAFGGGFGKGVVVLGASGPQPANPGIQEYAVEKMMLCTDNCL